MDLTVPHLPERLCASPTSSAPAQRTAPPKSPGRRAARPPSPHPFPHPPSPTSAVTPVPARSPLPSASSSGSAKRTAPSSSVGDRLPSSTSRTPSSFADCESWLHDLLVINGEMRPAEIIQLAREEGFSRSLLLSGPQPLGKPHPQFPSQEQPDEHLEALRTMESPCSSRFHRFCAPTSRGSPQAYRMVNGERLLIPQSTPTCSPATSSNPSAGRGHGRHDLGRIGRKR